MEGAFAWIGRIAEWIGQFIPKGIVIDTRHQATKWNTILLRDLVRFRWDASAKVSILAPGFHVYWPVVTTVEQYPVKRQSVALAPQVVTTTDGFEVLVSGLLVYSISDLIKIQAETWDPEETIREIALSGVHDVCCRQSLDYLRTEQGKKLDTALRNEVRKDLDEYGVQVIKVTLTTMAKTAVVRVVQTREGEGVRQVMR